MNFSLDSLDETGKLGEQIGEDGRATDVRQQSIRDDDDLVQLDDVVTRSFSPLASSASQLSTPSNSSPPLIPCDLSALPAWEKWMVQKTREDLIRRHAHRKKLHDEQVRKTNERQEVIGKKRRSEQVHREWLEAVTAREREKRELAKRAAAEKIDQEQEKKEVLEVKSRKNFTEWCQRKDKEKAMSRKREEEAEKEKTQVKAERVQRSQKVYNLWLESMYRRTRHSPTADYGLDRPVYCNPDPWVGPVDVEASRTKPSSRRHHHQRPFS